MAAGAQHRFGCAPPKVDPVEFAEFDLHVQLFITTNFTPLLSPNDDIQQWLDQSNYSETDRKRLLEVYNNISTTNTPKPYLKTTCGAFCKDEFYDEMKPARSINARHDVWKIFFGPIVQSIEREVFKHPSFIKKVPYKLRPDYILEIMSSPLPIIVEGDDGLMLCWASDYSAYESLFTVQLFRTCEYRLCHYMLGGGQFATWFCNILWDVCYGQNRNRYSSGLMIEVLAKRMSGEMITSLGNGATNLFVLSFLYEKYIKKGIEITSAHFERLGLRAKLEKHDDPSEASFCGMIFDPADRQMIRDPVPTLLKLGWSRLPYVYSSDKTMLKLLRLKALSLACENNACPVLSAVAKRLLDLTATVVKHDRHLYKYLARHEKDKMETNVSAGHDFPLIGMGTRGLFEKKYGISIADQLRLEAMAAEMQLGPAPRAFLELLCPNDRFFDFWDHYVSPTPTSGFGWEKHSIGLECAGRPE